MTEKKQSIWKKKVPDQVLSALIVLAVILYIILDNTPDTQPNPEQPAPAQVAMQGNYINGDSHYGCMHKADYDKTAEYVAQNDREAFKQFLGLGIATGVCIMFKAGEPVILVDVGIFTSKVRRKGELAEYWVSSEALQ